MNISYDVVDNTFLNNNYNKYSMKELHKICEYYEIVKISKYKKGC